MADAAARLDRPPQLGKAAGPVYMRAHGRALLDVPQEDRRCVAIRLAMTAH